MTFEKIVIIDDELSVRKMLEHHLRKQRYTVAGAGTLAEGEGLLQRERFDLVLLDLCLPDGDGTELLKRVVEGPDAPAVVVMTAYSSVESAVRCMRAGAFDYIVKPCSLDELDVIIDRAAEFRHMVSINHYMESELRCEGDIVGKTAAIEQLRSMVAKVAPTEATVLILGESGTGKSLVAEAIHRASPRAAGPIIKINCAATDPDQLESELFGHEKGAFPWANEKREGRMELAQTGTLILEEVSELPQRIQVKLLRVLQEHEFERAGGCKPIRADVRIIATTRRDLSALVERGRFRQDLFLRLNVFPVSVPALRERIADLPEIVNHTLDRFARRHGLKLAGVTEDALHRLITYSWPGNMRELQNVLERAAILTEPEQKIEVGAFEFLRPQPVMNNNDEPLLTLEEIEKRHVLRALQYTNQNRTRAAHLLKISVRTLRNKLHQYRMETPELVLPRVQPGARATTLPIGSPVPARNGLAEIQSNGVR
jgi:DNA-binding NtrC family response regulator